MNTPSILNNPLVLLFVVSAVGYALGRLKLAGNSLGISAILFVGLFVGALDPINKIPIIVFELGLVLFVYNLGVSTGKAFFRSIKRNGVRDISFVLLSLMISAGLAIGLFYIWDINADLLTGVYSGTTTNTPALAGVIQLVREKNITGFENITEALTVGYTFAYPMGILGVMLAFKLMQKLFKIDYKEEYKTLRKTYSLDGKLSSVSVKITNQNLFGLSIRDVSKQHKLDVLYGRVCKGDSLPQLTNWNTIVEEGNDLIIIGNLEELQKAVQLFGEESENNISYDRKHYDVRNIFVSNPKIVGKEIASLNLNQNYDAIITRIRRGDIDMLARPNLVIEQGDRIRFIARREELAELSKMFGDSYNVVSQINIFTMGIGIALGLLLGSISIPLFYGVTFKLGIAGGPLIVGLLLGTIGRTGLLTWSPSYGVNTTISQFGLALLLAVIGVNSGNSFISNLDNGVWMMALSAGAIISILSTIISIFIGYKLFKIPYSLLLGFLSNHPALLDYSKDMTKNRLPAISYAVMFPIALIMKVLFAQLLFLFLS